ncbi:MAG: hypothetical protein WCJ84_00735 [Candidatus Peregrinibacteria bacterium]
MTKESRLLHRFVNVPQSTATGHSHLNKIQSGTGDLTDTRNKETNANWDKGLTEGLATSGGLYMPEEIQTLPDGFIAETLPTLNTAQIAAALLRQFIPREAIDDATLSSFTEQALGFGIPLEDITKMFSEGESPDKVFVAWLDRGKTASFKDFAAQTIGQLMEWWCEKNQTPKNIVVATSGDTGVAIARAFAGSKWVTVTVLYPADGVAAPQEAQMIEVAQKYKNIQCLPCAGTFDDAQARAKILQQARDKKITKEEQENPDEKTIETVAGEIQKMLKDTVGEEIKLNEAKRLVTETKELDLSSANSINIWRLIPQMTQYFTTYANLVRSGQITNGQKIVFVIPTGNVGHITAGLFAKKLGLPVEKFVMATNENNMMHNLLENGVLQQDGFHATDANSMDIEKPSNLERILYLAQQEADPDVTVDYAGLAKKMAEQGAIQNGIEVKDFGVTDAMMAWLRENIVSASSTVEERKTIIKETHEKTGALLEWHGAAGAVAIQKVQENIKGFVTVLFETAGVEKAKPCSLEEATGILEIPEEYKNPAMQDAMNFVLEGSEKNDLAEATNAMRETVVNSIMGIFDALQNIAQESAERRESPLSLLNSLSASGYAIVVEEQEKIPQFSFASEKNMMTLRENLLNRLSHRDYLAFIERTE